MKKIIALSMALFSSLASFSQNDTVTYKTKDKTMEMSKTDGVIMQNGSMMTLKKGKISAMSNDLVCKDGTRVSTRGSVSKKDGTRMMLKEGEYMDVCGKIMPINNYKNPTDKNNSKTGTDKNMYLVPDSSLQKNK